MVLKKSEIAGRKKSPISIMPKGLLDKLTREEILDLVAYVAAGGDPEPRRCSRGTTPRGMGMEGGTESHPAMAGIETHAIEWAVNSGVRGSCRAQMAARLAPPGWRDTRPLAGRLALPFSGNRLDSVPIREEGTHVASADDRCPRRRVFKLESSWLTSRGGLLKPSPRI